MYMAKTEPQKHIASMFGVCKIEQSRNKKFFFDSLILCWPGLVECRIEFIRECAVCATRNIRHRQSRSTNNVFIWYRVCFASPLWYFPKKTRQLFSSVILPFSSLLIMFQYMYERTFSQTLALDGFDFIYFLLEILNFSLYPETRVFRTNLWIHRHSWTSPFTAETSLSLTL